MKGQQLRNFSLTLIQEYEKAREDKVIVLDGG